MENPRPQLATAIALEIIVFFGVWVWLSLFCWFSYVCVVDRVCERVEYNLCAGMCGCGYIWGVKASKAVNYSMIVLHLPIG